MKTLVALSGVFSAEKCNLFLLLASSLSSQRADSWDGRINKEKRMEIARSTGPKA